MNNTITNHPLVYLASPYSHRDKQIEKMRYYLALNATKKLLETGIHTLSPIVGSYHLHNAGLGGTWQFWAGYDMNLLSRCDILFVYTVPGWEESVGVTAEIKFAAENGIPVFKGTVEGFIEYCKERGML